MPHVRATAGKRYRGITLRNLSSRSPQSWRSVAQAAVAGQQPGLGRRDGVPAIAEWTEPFRRPQQPNPTSRPAIQLPICRVMRTDPLGECVGDFALTYIADDDKGVYR